MGATGDEESAKKRETGNFQQKSPWNLEHAKNFYRMLTKFALILSWSLNLSCPVLNQRWGG
jgi:hypothetical protein